MGKVKIQLDSGGIQAMLKSSEIMSALQGAAEEIRSQLGESFQTSQYIGKTRGNVSVYTTDREALAENSKSNTMLKAMGVKVPAGKSKGKGQKSK